MFPATLRLCQITPCCPPPPPKVFRAVGFSQKLPDQFMSNFIYIFIMNLDNLLITVLNMKPILNKLLLPLLVLAQNTSSPMLPFCF